MPLLDQSYIEDTIVRRNARASLIDGMWYSVMVGLTNPFFGVFAMKLGATDYLVGLLASLPALVAMLSQLPGAAYTNRFARHLDPVIRSAWAYRVFYLVFAVIPFINIRGVSRAWLFVILLAVSNLPGTACGVAWTALMGKLFPGSIRGVLFGERNMAASLVTLIATAIAGVWLDAIRFPYNYSSLYVISFGCLMASLYYLTKLREEPSVPVLRQPAAARAGSSAPAPSSGHRPAGGLGRLALRSHPRFVSFTAASFVFHLGLNLTVAVFTILFVRLLHLPQVWIGAFATLNGVTSVLTYQAWGRIADRRGNLWVLVASTAGFAASIALYAVSGSPWFLSLLMLVGGVCSAGFSLALFNGVLDVTPQEGRATYVAVFNTLMGATGFLSPIAGVFLLDRVGLAAVFIISAAVRFAGVALYWREMKTATQVARLT
ncbi:MAG: MFS transporter [Bacillota bacterium]